MLSRILHALDSDVYTFFAHSKMEISEEFMRFYESFRAVSPEVRGKVMELLELIRQS